MNLAALSIKHRAITNFAVVLLLVGGIFSYFQLGQLEDPEFTVKTAGITTVYPGTSAEQVELEVTDRIETKLQEMPEIKNIYSNSRPGLSVIKVDIKDQYTSAKMPQVWDVLRKKIRDIETSLPPARGVPRSAMILVTYSAFCWPSPAMAIVTRNSSGASRICGRS